VAEKFAGSAHEPVTTEEYGESVAQIATLVGSVINGLKTMRIAANYRLATWHRCFGLGSGPYRKTDQSAPRSNRPLANAPLRAAHVAAYPMAYPLPHTLHVPRRAAVSGRLLGSRLQC
jgi:hypothetical protein